MGLNAGVLQIELSRPVRSPVIAPGPMKSSLTVAGCEAGRSQGGHVSWAVVQLKFLPVGPGGPLVSVSM